MKKPLYVYRPVLNGKVIAEWAKENGVEAVYEPEDMHVTIMFSKEPVEWDSIPESNTNRIEISGNGFEIDMFGKSTMVIKFNSNQLQKDFKRYMDGGCSFDFPQYTPHISFSDEESDVKTAFEGTIVLGKEVREDIDLDWSAKTS